MHATNMASLTTRALVLLALAAALPVNAQNLPTQVSIPAGVLSGTTTSLPGATATVNKWLGVPFAASPPKRFTPPQAPAKFAKPIDATQFKDACVQEFPYPQLTQEFTKNVFNEPPPTESEDCLYLNVYAPSTPAPAGGRAVLFWIYGGALEFGNAGTPPYDGSAFASYQDVIVVAPNYRTNVFGFPNAPGLPTTGQNLGFLDQRFALEWVQRNIHVFGGSKDKVTIFGESAGAFSVDALLTSFNTSEAPFRGAILESGQISYNAFPRVGTPNGFATLAKALNCSSGMSQLDCVRAAPAKTIQSIIEMTAITFQPVVDNLTYVASPAGNRAAGNFAKVPVLGGTNAQEGRVFEFGQTNLTGFLQSTFGLYIPEIIPAIEAAFPTGDIMGYNMPYDVISEIFTLAEFQCGQALWANETAAQGVPTWRYYYNASFPNTEIFTGSGVYHSSEIVQVFQTYAGGPVNANTPTQLGLQNTQRFATAQQGALSEYMVHLLFQ